MMRNGILRVSSIVAVSVIVAGMAICNHARADSAPTQAKIDFAHGAMDRLQSELFAALLNEFDNTDEQNFDQGILAIQLIFDNRNRAMRLVGEMDPLGGDNNLPADDFEIDSLERAMQGMGNEATEKIQGKWYVRRSIPLSNFDPSCVICHTNFGAMNPAQWTGALMLRVPTDPAKLP